MPLKNSYLTLTDQFCGAGGSSLGARKAGVEVKLALNHWMQAIETHSANFKETDHDCADMSNTDPRRYGSTDMLVTSPSCTKQTKADGKEKPKKQYDMFNKPEIDEAADRSRATMWDVPRFAEYHSYNYIIVENVVETREWIMFDAWLKAMYALGYQHKCVYHNSMFSWPTPQSRDRMYIHFWKKGNKAPDLNYYPPARCLKCEKDVNAVQSWKHPLKRYGVYGKRGQYVYCCPTCTTVVNPYYYAAINCIDFSDIGRKIGDRKKTLSANTIRRINVGKEMSFTTPFYIQHEHSKSTQNIRLVTEALPTQTTRQTMAFVFPSNSFTSLSSNGMVPEQHKSFLSYYNSGSDGNSCITAPVGTITTTDRVALVSGVSEDINEWYYRVIKAHEVKKGMGFDDDYIVLGDAKAQVKQCGNAVTPPAMEWQIKRAVETFN